jgi:two-component system, NarL family, response regulator NreC
MSIKVVVADDNAVIRSAIIRMLKSDTDLEVTGEASTFRGTLELVDSLKPDIVLLDLHMPDERDYSPGNVKLEVLLKAGCILAISVWNDDEAKALAEQFGAKALIDKAHLFSELIPAIKLFCRSNPADESQEHR